MKVRDRGNRESEARAQAALPCSLSKFLGLPALGGLCALLAVGSLLAQTGKPTEYQVKAAYLFNFGKFVAWAPGSGETKSDAFSICVLGKNPFGAALDGLAGQTINRRSVTIRQISRAQDAGKCNVLFVAVSEQEHLPEILGAIQKRAVLTVSDMPHFVARGGMIEFVIQDNKVRFQVNRAAAETAGLSFSSELLKVATNVKIAP